MPIGSAFGKHPSPGDPSADLREKSSADSPPVVSSPDGTSYQVTVDDKGNLGTTKVK